MKALWNKLFVPTLVITLGFVASNLYAAYKRTSLIAVIALLIVCNCVLAALQETKQSEKSDNRNYTEVRLTLDQWGLLNMEAEVEGVKMNLILDTGTSPR